MTGNLTIENIAGQMTGFLGDIFGGGTIGIQIAGFLIFGTVFLIIFGRQRNVILPLFAFLFSAFFILQYVISQELTWIVYAFAAAALGGIIFYIARRRD